jgi:hypothetical protein
MSLKHIIHQFIMYSTFTYNSPIMECGSVHCQRFCDLKLLLAPALYVETRRYMIKIETVTSVGFSFLNLKKVCYPCMVMHNIHKERQNNVTKFYIQQLHVQILLLNILSTNFGCLLLIKIPKTQVLGDATLCHWVGVTHPVFPCLDYLTQMTKAL